MAPQAGPSWLQPEKSTKTSSIEDGWGAQTPDAGAAGTRMMRATLRAVCISAAVPAVDALWVAPG